MRDLVNKLFGQGQEEEASEKLPQKASVPEPEKEGAAPVGSEVVAEKDNKEGKSTDTEPASSDLPLEKSRNDTSATDGLMSDAAPPGTPTLDESQSIEAVNKPATSPHSQRSAIDETAESLRPVQLEEPHRTSPLLQAVHSCHIGNVRTRNEDSTYIFTAEAGGQEPMIPFGLYIVADGMGGHHAGHEASRDVSRIIAEHVLNRIYLPLIKKSTNTSGSLQEPIHDVIVDAIQIANQKIHNPEPGMESGTTLTAALIFGRRLYVAQVGDSRAYLLSENRLRQVTIDHSYVRRLIDAGEITEEEAAIHPQRNMLYKAVGQGGLLEIDTFTQTLPKNGTLIICSDGLWGLVSDIAITQVVQKHQPLWIRGNELVDLALGAGGQDNISIVLVSFGF